MAYPVLADIKAYLGTSQPGDDALLTALMTAAIAYIEGPTGADRRFAVTADTTRRFDANGDVVGRTLRLDEDLCQITSVTNGDGATVASGDYVTEPRNHAPYRALTLKFTTTAPIWTWNTTPEDAIVIVGRWGYSITPPADIAQAFKAMVAYFYRRRSSSGSQDGTVVAEGIVITPATMPKDIQGILTAYRRRWLS